MPEDPEVNLIFNAESEEAQRKLQELVAKFEGISESITRAGEKLKSFEADARDLADNAGRLDELAAKSGNAKAIKDVNAVFSAGVAAVAGYGEEVTKCTNSLMSFGAGASKALSDFKNGSISFKEAEAALERYTAFAAKSEGVVDSLSKKVVKGVRELGRAAELDDALSAWGRLSDTTGQARKQLAEADKAVQQQLTALAALRDGLDATSESYASQELAITRQENVLKKQAAEIKGLREELLGLSMAVRESFSEKNTSKGFGGALSKLTELEKDVGAAVESTSKALSTQEVETARFTVVSQRATNAIEKEARKEKENAYAMKLAAMSKTQLAAETRKLIEERKKAAAVGDVAAYQKLTAQLGLCRTAMRGLVQQQQVNKIAMLQQAQTVAQMGGQLESVVGGIANFGKAAKEGSVNVTGLASSVMSLSMAIKAGLGPLGWALMAVQGLQMAWNAYAKDAKANEERTLKLADANDKLRDALQGVGRAEAQRRAEEMKSRWAEEDALREYARAIDEANANEDDRRAREAIERAAEKAQREIAIERRELETKKKLGQVSDAEYEAKLLELARRERKIEQKKQADLQQIAVDAAKRRVEAASEAYQTAEGRVQEVKDKLGENYEYLGDEQVEKLIGYIRGIENEQQDIQAQIDNTKAVGEANESLGKDIVKWAGRFMQYAPWIRLLSDFNPIVAVKDRIEDEEKQLEHEITTLNGKLEGAGRRLDVAYNKLAEVLKISAADAAKFVGSYETNWAQKRSANAARMKAEVDENAAQNALDQAQDAQKNGREQRAAQEKTQRSLEDLAEAATEAARARKEQLEKVQRTGSLEEQKRVLVEQRREMKKGSEEWKKYTAQIRTLNQKMREERLSELARTQGPNAVMAELERLRGRVKEGSDAWKRYTKQLQGLEVQKIREEQQKLHRELEISTTYQRVDNRSRAKILEADRKRLRIEEADLQRRIASTDDYELKKQLTEQLKENLKQQKYLGQNAAKMAKEEGEQLKNMRALGLEVKKGSSQRAFNSQIAKLQRGWAKLQEAVAGGKDEEIRAAWEDCKKVFAALKKAAADPAKIAELEKAMKESGSMGRTVELTRENWQKTQRASSREAEAANKKAAAAERTAQLAEQQAQKPEAQAQQNTQSAQQATAATQQATAATARLNAQIDQLKMAVDGLKEQQAGLSPAVAELSNAVQGLGSAVNSAINALNAAVSGVQGQISNLQKQIDSIWRKI